MANTIINNPDEPWKDFQEDTEMGWGETLVTGAEQLPSSTLGVAGHIYEAVTHPIETGTAIIKLMSGGLQNLLGDDISNFINEKGQLIGLGDDSKDKEIASAVGQHFKDKYGSEDAIKKAIATDPASVMMDVALVFTGGGALVSKVGEVSKISQLSNAGNTMKNVAGYVDPLSLTVKAAGGLYQGGKLAAKEGFGMSTGAGSQSFSEAFKAGKTGGETSKQFLQHMRKDKPMEDIVNLAQKDLEIIKKQKQAEYKANKKTWIKDKKILDFNGIDKTLIKVKKLVSFKGKTINVEGERVLNEINAIIKEWKQFNPKAYHTPEGLDKLKQKVWEVVQSASADNMAAQALGKTVYNSIKETIAKQSPGYSQAMKQYQEATELVQQIQKTFSFKDKKTNIDTAIRKLQSLMRDNVSTNYGNRLNLGRTLEEAGHSFMPAIAGQQLKSWSPRGIQRAGVVPIATGMATGSLPLMGASVAATSPRLIGEITHALGKGSNLLPKVQYSGIQALLESLYQIQETK